ncbi:uncharacterized protein LOC126581694 [Anopheles aquasalis]|uniref:uncharacterized protein LOC126581694 n=1 Tax=Anopheles aquasalis TaxID=42839 RepID=UPI00215A6B89|nr:uncharacterized protein LOC126581694 [Anopheles aquasalis]
MQFIVTTLLLGTIHVTVGGFLDWFRGNQEQEVHRVGPIHIEVLLPKGIRLWTHYNPDVKLFGVELYVKYNEGQTEALECALCRNTTVPVYGKFLLQDDEVEARAGDVLEYVIITSDGETDLRHTKRRTVVHDDLIRTRDRPCDCTERQSPDLLLLEPATEVELLERMIHRVLANRSRSCESLSKWLVLRVEPRNELADVEQHVRTVVHRMMRVAVLLDMDGARLAISNPNELIDRVEDHPDGIAFRVRSVMEKLKLLELLRSSRLVVDYDGIFSRAPNSEQEMD